MPEPRVNIVLSKPGFQRKALKIRVSPETCVLLHSRKILSGITIAETVAEALEAYFRQPARLLASEAADAAMES